MALRLFLMKVSTTSAVQRGKFSFSLARPISTGIVLPGNGKKESIEVLWRDFFSNTSQWLDHRVEKINPRFPDFKHKKTQESLWLDNAQNPKWVQVKLAAMQPGTLQINVFGWTQKLKRLVKARQYKKAMQVFHQMQQEKISLDSWTFLPVLKACAGLGALEEGRRVHRQIIQVGCEANVYVANCLVDMYAKCRSIGDAWSVFNKMQEHNVVTWNTMIGGHVKCGQELKALDLFQKMQWEGVEPDAVTFVGVLNACASAAALQEGSHVHEQIIQRGCESNIYVATCLVDMYAKCGSIADAWMVFNNMQEHNVITWNAMLGAYVKSGQGLKAMELFREMQQEGVAPNPSTFVGLLNACASVGALEEGRRAHKQILHLGCESDVNVATCLVDMYSKCGSIEDAWCVFNKLQEYDMVTWSAMIGGYSMHGHAEKAIGLFRQMSKSGVEINAVTFTSLLSACSHGGLLKEGLRYFKSMTLCSNIVQTREHYACMVDLLGRAGWLMEAEALIRSMPLERDACLWRSLLGSCSIHGNIEMAERVAKQCWELDPGNPSGYVLLSNIYAAGNWETSATMKMRGRRGNNR